MNIWIILLTILGIIIIVAIFQQGGWDGFKSSPLQSSWDATKSIGEVGKDAFDKGKEIIGSDKTGSSSGTLKNLGLPLCNTNSSCNTLQECKDNLCSCINGECFIQT